MKRALLLADRSVYNYYSDFAEKGYYNRIIAGNINQVLNRRICLNDVSMFFNDLNSIFLFSPCFDVTHTFFISAVSRHVRPHYGA